MKNNLIKIIKKSLLLATVLFISCSKDNYEDLGKENNNSKYKLTVLNSKELKKQGKLVKKLENFRAFTKLQNDNNKTATSSIYNFSIETRNVKLIETESIKTYTFKVNRTIDNELFENLLISQLSDGSYTVKLLQYNLSESEKTALLSGTEIDVNGKLNVINIDDQNLITDIIGKFQGDCFDTIFVYQEPHNCQGPDTHAPGNIDCPYWFTDQSMAASYGGYVSFIVSVDCDGGGGGDGLGVITTPVGGDGTGNISAQDLFFAGITEQQQEWIDSQSESVFANILNYFNQNGYSEANRNKIYQLMNYLIQNPSVSYEQYINWFSLELPGKENTISYDSSFWDNPNLSFPQQQLPSYATFKQNFPGTNVNAQQLCTSIGGEILTLHNAVIALNKNLNTCAIRLSKALNDSGIIIPNIPEKTKAGTLNGINTKYYFTFAADANAWMLEVFGSNGSVGIGPQNDDHVRYTYQELQPFIDPANGNILSPNNPIGNLQGIFSMISNNPGWSTGHCDLLQPDNTCINSCHFEGPIKHIDIWILN